MMMSSFRRGLAAAIVGGMAATAIANVALAQEFPDPTDEAALYEAAKAEGSVVWYVGMPPDVAKNVTDVFTAKYPGVNVETVRLVSVEQFQRFSQESQAGQGVADVLYEDAWSINALNEMGFLASWTPPGAAFLPPDAIVGDYAYVQAYASSAIAYNPNNVTPEEVEKLKTWKGILDPVFKGRFAVSNQVCSSCYTPIHMFLDPALADEYGEKFLHEVAAQQPHVYADINLAVDQVAAGEDDIVWCCSWGALANARYVKGAPIQWIFPTPTPVVAEAYITISKIAPHPNAARLFENWFISPEGLAAQQKFFGDASALSNAPDSMPATKEPWYQPVGEQYKIDQDRWNANLTTDLQIWQKALADR